ncbi:hypothetical protein SARC_04441 [Sphaeroforma arctica JP610]|uniref:Uncharacterized protein n=1 Tax=Sphaeroforma arctica JP610 TaxID=667725 RepID=A0A0L0G2D4_9EUKA|nr:hypothetical protein SARC_04441 [Sphaeroforma arctica JP610]KNC83297.1 hypothetical protein SARC_04441 [Sphaeroforma arctica JP610]|eukprot:XP_014157199.1 hypothetical protein SARC_04441 [Sphaeroforma arctica JP610]
MLLATARAWAYVDSDCTYNLITKSAIQRIGVEPDGLYEGPPLSGLDDMGELSPSHMVAWQQLESYLLSLIRWQWLKDTNVPVPSRVKAILEISKNGRPVSPRRKRRKVGWRSAGAAVAMRQLAEEYAWHGKVAGEAWEQSSEASDGEVYEQDLSEEVPAARVRMWSLDPEGLGQDNVTHREPKGPVSSMRTPNPEGQGGC